MTVEQFLVKMLAKQCVESVIFITPYYGYIDLKSKSGDKGKIDFSLISQDLYLLNKKIEDEWNV